MKKILLEMSDEFLAELKTDLAAGIVAARIVGEIAEGTKLSLCIYNAVGKGEQSIMRNDKVLISAKLLEETC